MKKTCPFAKIAAIITTCSTMHTAILSGLNIEQGKELLEQASKASVIIGECDTTCAIYNENASRCGLIRD